MANDTSINPEANTKLYAARTFAVNDNRELHPIKLELEISNNEVRGAATGMFADPAVIHGIVTPMTPEGYHMLLRHGERGAPNQAMISLVGGTLGLAGEVGLVGTFKYTTNGHHEVPSWPVHHMVCALDRGVAPVGEAPDLIEAFKAPAASSTEQALVIVPGKEYYVMDSAGTTSYLSVEYQGKDKYNWAYRGNRFEHDYAKVKFTQDPLGDFANLTLTNKAGELRTLRTNSDVTGWAYTFWGDGSQTTDEPALQVKAERVSGNTFRLYHQRKGEKMWLGFGGSGGNWGIVKNGAADDALIFTIVEVPPQP